MKSRVEPYGFRQGSDSAVVVARGFLDFWQKDTALHFRKEEEVLLPVMARYGEDISREPLVEMIEDHARIRALLSDEAIGGNVRLETLHEIGEVSKRTSVLRSGWCFHSSRSHFRKLP